VAGNGERAHADVAHACSFSHPRPRLHGGRTHRRSSLGSA
jgi:hypothetical protein